MDMDMDQVNRKSRVLEGLAAHLENLRFLGHAGLHHVTSVTKPVLCGDSLQAVRSELGDCVRCKLSKSRQSIVFGSGNPAAEIVFVGEGPGADEDEQGLPFVGRAGQLLTKIIEAMGYQREAVYICNVVKCRPPNNRNPEPDELAACGPFWRKQIAAIAPRVIVTLGNVPTQTLLNTEEGIGKLRGRFHQFPTGQGTIPLMPTYHPAFLLRSPDHKRHTWEDMKKVRDLLQDSARVSL